MKNDSAQVCEQCGKSFKGKSNLNRHINIEHKECKSHVCEACGKTFSRKDVLLRHEREVHEKIRHKCSSCSKEFSTKSNLSKHQKTCGQENFICNDCNGGFQSKLDIIRHIKANHRPKKSTAKPDSVTFTCVLCHQTCPKERDIVRHYASNHNQNVASAEYSFETEPEFNKWKKDQENSCRCTFRKFSRWKTSTGMTVEYICNRSGYYRPAVPSASRQRLLKFQGSKKINGFCPAKMIVRVADDGTRKVDFRSTHIGHSTDYEQLKHMRYSSDDVKTIANILAAGVKARVIEDTLTGISKSKNCLEKIDLLNRKDLYNIASAQKINIKRSDRSKSSNIIDVESWIEKNPESVCHFKRQFEEDKSVYGLRLEDFVLVIMTKEQMSYFSQYASRAILIDGTYEISQGGDYLLHTILVRDNFDEGVPACITITNRNDQLPMDIMFNCIRSKFGKVHTTVLMTGLQTTGVNSWTKIMNKPDHHLLCSWHVTQSWQKNYKKVNDQSKRQEIKHDVLRLLREPNIIEFHKQLNSFLEDDDEDKKQFISYFAANFGTNYDKWAYCYCYYHHVGVNTNISLERFHGAFKYSNSHVKGLSLTQVQETLHHLDTYLLKKRKDDLRTSIMGGKLSHKLVELRREHKKAVENSDKCEIFDIDDENWTIKSLSQIGVEYRITKVIESCSNCSLMCSECHLCAHIFSCSCQRNSIDDVMCQHIHLLCLKEMIVEAVVDFSEDDYQIECVVDIDEDDHKHKVEYEDQNIPDNQSQNKEEIPRKKSFDREMAVKKLMKLYTEFFTEEVKTKDDFLYFKKFYIRQKCLRKSLRMSRSKVPSIKKLKYSRPSQIILERKRYFYSKRKNDKNKNIKKNT